jgi:hypothetical protein
MSYYTCGYCHTRGHNRTTCEDYRIYVERIRLAYGDSHPVVQKYDMRRSNRTTNRKPRACSYCRQEGHINRNCQTRQEKLREVHNLNVVFRKHIYQKMMDSGYGPGTLVYSQWHKKYFLVSGIIETNQINIWDTAHYFICRSIDTCDNYKYNMKLFHRYCYSYDDKVVRPANQEKIANWFSENWFENKDSLQEIVNDRKSSSMFKNLKNTNNAIENFKNILCSNGILDI